LVPWLEANVPSLTAPVEFLLIAGGHSNLTYKVTDAKGAEFVLRRPPLGHVLATAHDMGREFRVISALGPTAVPVPQAIVFCDDLSVNGTPFYVMGFVEGHIIRDDVIAEKVLTPDQRRRAGETLIDVLADIHAVDPDAVGLGDLGRRGGYIERQLNRWYKQFQASQTRQLPAVDEVYRKLLTAIPDQVSTTIVHGDYRLDNCMVDDEGTVNAVLDWEICTLGDPLADLGLLTVYWTEPGEEGLGALTSPTVADGFPRRAELLERYAARSGRDLATIDYYTAFGYWKLACIVEGVYARYLGGALGDDATGFDGYDERVVLLAGRAEEAAAKV
jgi:aminoglycoside phosphotransferase (APT) family kinase protein